MQKIVFEDTTVVKSPYVIIDGVEHEVYNGTYQGGTDLNAQTFNQMQDNIESAIDTVSSDIPTVVDSLDGSSTTDAPSVHAVNEKIDEITTYSTSEIKIGTWIDGKPLYRKCFEKTGNVSTITTGINDLDSVINLSVTVKNTDNNYWRTIPWNFNDSSYNSGYTGGVYVSNTGNVIGFQAGSGLTNASKYIVIIEYTKSTD